MAELEIFDEEALKKEATNETSELFESLQNTDLLEKEAFQKGYNTITASERAAAEQARNRAEIATRSTSDKTLEAAKVDDTEIKEINKSIEILEKLKGVEGVKSAINNGTLDPTSKAAKVQEEYVKSGYKLWNEFIDKDPNIEKSVKEESKTKITDFGKNEMKNYAENPNQVTKQIFESTKTKVDEYLDEKLESFKTKADAKDGSGRLWKILKALAYVGAAVGAGVGIYLALKAASDALTGCYIYSNNQKDGVKVSCPDENDIDFCRCQDVDSITDDSVGKKKFCEDTTNSTNSTNSKYPFCCNPPNLNSICKGDPISKPNEPWVYYRFQKITPWDLFANGINSIANLLKQVGGLDFGSIIKWILIGLGIIVFIFIFINFILPLFSHHK